MYRYLLECVSLVTVVVALSLGLWDFVVWLIRGPAETAELNPSQDSQQSQAEANKHSEQPKQHQEQHQEQQESWDDLSEDDRDFLRWFFK